MGLTKSISRASWDFILRRNSAGTTNRLLLLGPLAAEQVDLLFGTNEEFG
jgi:hypothetical protein